MRTTVAGVVGKFLRERTYAGVLSIGKSMFTYVIGFLSDDEVENRRLCLGQGLIQDDRAAYRLTLKKEGIVLDLTDEDYELFNNIVITFVDEFINTPIVRQKQEMDQNPYFQEEMSYRGLIPINFLSLMERDFDLTPRERTILNLKFGCQLETY